MAQEVVEKAREGFLGVEQAAKSAAMKATTDVSEAIEQAVVDAFEVGWAQVVDALEHSKKDGPDVAGQIPALASQLESSFERSWGGLLGEL